MSDTKDYLLTLDEELHTRLKLHTVKSGVSMKDFITLAILEKLSEK